MAFMDRFKSKWAHGAPASAVKPAEVLVEEKQTKSKPLSKSVVTSSAVRANMGILMRPLVTEKSAIFASMGKYVFVVDIKVGRVQVAQAVAAKYGIRPVQVNIQNIRGKAVRFGRHAGAKKSWKKAIVTLPKGKTIDIYQGV